MSIPERKKAIVALAGLALVTTSACSTRGESPQEGNPRYLFERVASIRSEPALDDVLEPTSLAEAMPNHQFVVDTGVKQVDFSFSEAVVAGNVREVEPGDGYIYDDGDEGRVVEFSDPEAQARDLVVTVAVDEASGTTQRNVQFRMGVLDGSDPDELMASLSSLEDVVVVLDEIDSGRHTGEYIPVMSGALIGTVDAEGTTDFPALGKEENQFVDSVDTVDEIFDEASTSLPPEELN